MHFGKDVVAWNHTATMIAYMVTLQTGKRCKVADFHPVMGDVKKKCSMGELRHAMTGGTGKGKTVSRSELLRDKEKTKCERF